MKFMRERDAEYIFRTELEGKLREGLYREVLYQRREEENLCTFMQDPG